MLNLQELALEFAVLMESMVPWMGTGRARLVLRSPGLSPLGLTCPALACPSNVCFEICGVVSTHLATGLDTLCNVQPSSNFVSGTFCNTMSWFCCNWDSRNLSRSRNDGLWGSIRPFWPCVWISFPAVSKEPFADKHELFDAFSAMLCATLVPHPPQLQLISQAMKQYARKTARRPPLMQRGSSLGLKLTGKRGGHSRQPAEPNAYIILSL